MDDEKRARWIRRLVLLGVIAGGFLAGFVLDLPGLKDLTAEEESQLEQVDPDNFRGIIATPNQLTVVNMRMDGNPDAEKLQKIIEQLETERTYGNQVGYAELDTVRHPEMAASQGVEMEDFAGQLDFYAAGFKLGTLEGPTDREEVEAHIQRYLAGLVKRFGPGWLPPVDGMKRSAKDDPILQVQPADPVPGMQPTGGGVPGMQPNRSARAPASPASP